MLTQQNAAECGMHAWLNERRGLPRERCGLVKTTLPSENQHQADVGARTQGIAFGREPVVSLGPVQLAQGGCEMPVEIERARARRIKLAGTRVFCLRRAPIPVK